MTDLTVILLTQNKLPEKWTLYHNHVLEEAISDYPLITISRKPLNWGVNILQTEPEGVSNIYWQMLKGIRLVTTPYVAIAEDDTLYTKEHFDLYRPPKDRFAYNMTRWGLFTWGKPTYFWKRRASNNVLIAPRQLVLEALEERFSKYPDGIPDKMAGELGRYKVEKRLGVTTRAYDEFYTTEPVVCFYHDYSIDHVERNHRKAMWQIRAYDIPVWGRAEDLVKKFV